MQRQACRQQGFTLIELLITITLLSLVVVVLFGGLHFGVRAWDGNQAAGMGAQDLATVQGLLRREIEQAYPFYNASDPLHPFVAFHGDESSLTFLAPAPQAVAGKGRSRITISAAQSPDGVALLIRGTPELASDGSGQWSAPLFRGATSIRLFYFDGVRWETNWEDKTAMPSLVRVEVEFPRRDGRVWPDLIVAPEIATDVGCIYDIQTRRCRGRA
jgi:general secretion pathway protein J